MTAPAAMFFLMLISQGAGSFSMHQIGSYDSRAACAAAQQALTRIPGLTPEAVFACIPEDSLGALQDANR